MNAKNAYPLTLIYFPKCALVPWLIALMLYTTSRQNYTLNNFEF